MKKQTAVEWLEEIYLTTGIDRNVHFNQAKEMEKEQIIDAHLAGEATLIIGVARGEGINNSSHDDKKDKIKGSIGNLTNRQIEITKQTAIDFANWLDKLQPNEKVSVWSKNGEWKGLFTMDNEQLFEKFEKQYTEPCNGNCGMNYCDDNGCLENKPKSEGEDVGKPTIEWIR